jgi:hypothetical protein
LSFRAANILVNGATSFNIATLSRMAPSIMCLIETHGILKHIIMLHWVSWFYCRAEFRYAVILLTVVMLSVVILSVVMLGVVRPRV